LSRVSKRRNRDREVIVEEQDLRNQESEIDRQGVRKKQVVVEGQDLRNHNKHERI